VLQLAEDRVGEIGGVLAGRADDSLGYPAAGGGCAEDTHRMVAFQHKDVCGHRLAITTSLPAHLLVVFVYYTVNY